MRTVISFVAACIVTLALFDFMRGLISRPVRDHERPVQATAVQLITLNRTTDTGAAGADGGGQAQPPTSAAATPSASAPVRAGSNEPQSTSLPAPNQEMVLPSPAAAPIDTRPVRVSPPVAVAKKAAVPQKKPQPGDSKTPTLPPTGKNIKKNSIDKKPPVALAAKPSAKPSVKPIEEFYPRLTAGRERQASGRSGPGGSNPDASGNSPVRSPAKEASAGSRASGSNPGASGNSPIGSPTKEASAGSGAGGSNPGASGNSPIAIISKTRPVYPRDALQRGEEGWVKVSFTITEQGRIENPAVVSSRPRQIFDQAALAAIVQWRFRPKMVNGKPVQTNAIQEIRFTLRQ